MASPRVGSLYDLLKDRPADDEILEIANALTTEPDASAALVACSLLELALERALVSRMIALRKTEHDKIFSDSDGGPLSTLSAKTRMAYVLGIIGPIAKQDFDRIRVVRNVFAHTRRGTSFATPEIEHACNTLHFSKGMDITYTLDAKMKFLMACANYAYALRLVTLPAGSIKLYSFTSPFGTISLP
jgi:DNA-binding MltR family transcriptional regulator